MKVQLEFKSCKDCPFLDTKAVSTSDSFERPESWHCAKKDGKTIDGYVDWYDKIPIPDWCPIKIE